MDVQRALCRSEGPLVRLKGPFERSGRGPFEAPPPPPGRNPGYVPALCGAVGPGPPTRGGTFYKMLGLYLQPHFTTPSYTKTYRLHLQPHFTLNSITAPPPLPRNSFLQAAEAALSKNRPVPILPVRRRRPVAAHNTPAGASRPCAVSRWLGGVLWAAGGGRPISQRPRRSTGIHSFILSLCVSAVCVGRWHWRIQGRKSSHGPTQNLCGRKMSPKEHECDHECRRVLKKI